MKINTIQTYNPLFTSIKRTEQSLPVTRPDTFVRSEFDFDKECDIYYSKLQKSMGIVKPQDVAVTAVRVSKKTGISLHDVYKTMGVLSQFSSYKSLESIERILNDCDIGLISGLPSAFLDKSLPISNVMSYISSKNLKLKGQENAIIVDSNLINTVKNMDTKARKIFLDYIKEFDYKLVYFDNFENGYNFLNQEKSFENFTIDVLKKAKSYQKNNGKSIDYNVQYILNGENYKNMRMLSGGGHIEVIRQDSIDTPEKIADNLNPILPSKEEFKSIIDEISQGKPKVQKEILSFLNKTMTVVTPKQYSQYLQDIHKQLLEYLEQHGKTMDDVYFVIPSVTKSFMPANYIYSKVNHIDNPKYVFLPQEYELMPDPVENLPEDAVAVVVDDCVLSGLSMLEEAFPYSELSHTLSKDKNIVFAPIISLHIGKQELERVINAKKRDDKIICGKLLQDYRIKSKNLTIVFDKINNSHLTTSLIFPYMGPDFNCEELIPVYGKFLYNKEAQKLPCGEINHFTLG